jgi:hypothetical protein
MKNINEFKELFACVLGVVAAYRLYHKIVHYVTFSTFHLPLLQLPLLSPVGPDGARGHEVQTNIP